MIYGDNKLVYGDITYDRQLQAFAGLDMVMWRSVIGRDQIGRICSLGQLCWMPAIRVGEPWRGRLHQNTIISGHQFSLSCSILIVYHDIVSPTLKVNPTLFSIPCKIWGDYIDLSCCK